MKNRLALLLALILILPIPITGQASGDNPPKVVIVSNKADMPTAKFIGKLLNQSGLPYTILGPNAFKEALKGYDVILLLGGPKAYDGMGNITSNYIPPSNSSTLIEEPKTFLISVFKGGRDIVVLAGHTRKDTMDAASYFFKDSIRLTSLWRWAGYPIDFRVGSFVIYYVARYYYDNKTGEFKGYPWGNVKTEALSEQNINGSTLYNVTTIEEHFYLDVNYTTVTVNLVDNLGRPHICKMVQFIDGNLSRQSNECPRPSRGSLGRTKVYVTFKFEETAKRKYWKIAGRNIRRSYPYPVGTRYIKTDLILKYAFTYPSWKSDPEFILLYVNPAIPFGGTVVRTLNSIVNGQPVTTEVMNLTAFRP